MASLLRLGFTKNPALFFMGSAAWQLSAGWAGIMQEHSTPKIDLFRRYLRASIQNIRIEKGNIIF